VASSIPNKSVAIVVTEAFCFFPAILPDRAQVFTNERGVVVVIDDGQQLMTVQERGEPWLWAIVGLCAIMDPSCPRSASNENQTTIDHHHGALVLLLFFCVPTLSTAHRIA
jgi:hypothetical protein